MSQTLLDLKPSEPGLPSVVPSRRPNYSVMTLNCTKQLRANSLEWDDLWRRSDIAAPSVRAELIAQWVEEFAPADDFCAVVVADGERFVAALPLVVKQRCGLRLATTPANGWSVNADLLIDPAADGEVVLDLLVERILAQRFAALWLDQVPFEELRWRQFQRALQRGGIPWHAREHYRIGQVQISGDWTAYESGLDGDHRRSRQRYSRMLEKAGLTELETYTGCDADTVARRMQDGFEIENRSWKSDSGTSVLQTAGMLDFYVRQAQQVAESGELELVFLKHQGRPIAFIYGWRSKGTHFVCKLGYDDEYRKYGPGQQMIMRLLKSLHEDPTRRMLDFWGPLVPWNASWSTSSYAVGRVVIPTSPIAGRALLHGYRDVLPALRKVRGGFRRIKRRQGDD